MKNKVIIEPKKKPQGIREWIAWRLVDLANWIRPGNEAGMAYLLGVMQEIQLEEMLYGRAEFEIKVKKHTNPKR